MLHIHVGGDRVTVGQNIRRYRQMVGMTQWQLSQIIGCSPGAILLIERGQRECDAELIRAIATALGVGVERLKA